MPDELFEKGAKVNPKNYRQLSEPFESPEEAEKVVGEFWEEFYALRNKYEIPDILLVLQFSIEYPEGEGIVLAKLYAGDERNGEGMAAFAYGQCSGERQERIAKNLNKVVTQRRPKK